MHLRMSGPKAMIAEIKRHEGSRIEITGLMKKGQIGQDGVGVGSGVRITGGPSGGGLPDPGAGQMMIDVEGWRRLPRDCRSRCFSFVQSRQAGDEARLRTDSSLAALENSFRFRVVRGVRLQPDFASNRRAL